MVTAREEEAGEREDLGCRTVPGEVCALLGLLTLPVTVLAINKQSWWVCKVYAGDGFTFIHLKESK